MIYPFDSSSCGIYCIRKRYKYIFHILYFRIDVFNKLFVLKLIIK